MAENKKTFIFYSDWVNMIREMPDEDAGQLLKHILSYVNDEDPETKNVLVRMAFGHMKPLLKADLEKWDGIREKRKKAGKKGGQANAKQKEANAKQVEAVNDNVNVNVNVNGNGNGNGNVTLKEKRKKKKVEFAKQILPLLSDDFTRDDANQFFEYWTEHGPKDKKMRFEKEKSFALSRRVSTWIQNKKKFAAKENKDTRVHINEATDRIKRGEFTEKTKFDWITPKKIEQ